jgi:hypothetical protein
VIIWINWLNGISKLGKISLIKFARCKSRGCLSRRLPGKPLTNTLKGKRGNEMYGRTVKFKTETGTVSIFVLCTTRESDEDIIKRAFSMIARAFNETAEVI